MFISRRILLTTTLFCFSTLSHAATSEIKSHPHDQMNKTSVYAGLLFLQPYSDDLKYATFVAGTQPYYQSWHYQAIRPSWHPAFEIGFNEAFAPLYSISGSWIHLNSNDSDSKQASTNTDLSTVEFVAPPYEMSPPVFGIKHVQSTANFAFDRIELDVVKWVRFTPHVHASFFGGLNILRLNHTVTTTFGDYAGSPATDYSYALPPDPSFSFETENVSKYLGIGPDLGVNLEYTTDSGWGFLGEITGLLTVGSISANDYFTSTSARLTSNGIGVSHQAITSPSASAIVFGVDSKLGVFYTFHGSNFPDTRVELGYRLATYQNAISTVSPNTLVQPGTFVVTPEFSTGTMAIVSTNAYSRPFTFNGPFLNVKVDLC